MRISQLRAAGTDRKWWVLAATTGPLAMILLDTTMIGVALPTIERELDLIVGRVALGAERLPRRARGLRGGGRGLVDAVNPVRLLAAGVIGFACASRVRGAAPGGNWLIAGRAVQGVCAAAMLPASLAIVFDAFAPGERGRAVGFRAAWPACSSCWAR